VDQTEQAGTTTYNRTTINATPPTTLLGVVATGGETRHITTMYLLTRGTEVATMEEREVVTIRLTLAGETGPAAHLVTEATTAPRLRAIADNRTTTGHSQGGSKQTRLLEVHPERMMDPHRLGFPALVL
jgi:hypothetical protein